MTRKRYGEGRGRIDQRERGRSRDRRETLEGEAQRARETGRKIVEEWGGKKEGEKEGS